MNLSEAEIDAICPTLADHEVDIIHNVSYYLEGIFQTGVASVGILANVISSVILTRREMRNSFNLLLVTLAAYDTWYLFGAILESCRKFFPSLKTDIHILLFPHFLYPLHQTSITGSIFMTVAIAFERYTAVHFPLDYNQAMNDDRVMRRRVAKFLFPVFALSLAFNIPKFFEAEIEYREEALYYDDYERMATNVNDTDFVFYDNGDSFLEAYDKSEVDTNLNGSTSTTFNENRRPQINLTDMRTHPWYSTYNTWSRFFVLGLIPFLLLLFFNVKIYRDIKERKRRRLLFNAQRPSRTLANGLVRMGHNNHHHHIHNPSSIGRMSPSYNASSSPPPLERDQFELVEQKFQTGAGGGGRMLSNGDGKRAESDHASPINNHLIDDNGMRSNNVSVGVQSPQPRHSSPCRDKSLRKTLCSVKKARRQAPQSGKSFILTMDWLSKKTKSHNSPKDQDHVSMSQDRAEIGNDGCDHVTADRENKNGTPLSLHHDLAPGTSPTLTPSKMSPTARSCPGDSPGTLRAPMCDVVASSEASLNGLNNGAVLNNGTSAAQKSLPKRNVSRRRTEDSLAVVFMAIIFIFLVSHAPRILLDIHELVTIENNRLCNELGRDNFEMWSFLLLNVSHFLLVLNSSVNMVVYCLLGSKFRAECRSIVSNLTFSKRRVQHNNTTTNVA